MGFSPEIHVRWKGCFHILSYQCQVLEGDHQYGGTGITVTSGIRS